MHTNNNKPQEDNLRIEPLTRQTEDTQGVFDYASWLSSLKQRIREAQVHAAITVNTELVRLYWQIGHDILLRQQQQGWGAKVVERLAKDLKTEFPEMTGLSSRNLKYMRLFANTWDENEIVQAPLAQL